MDGSEPVGINHIRKRRGGQEDGAHLVGLAVFQVDPEGINELRRFVGQGDLVVQKRADLGP